jgi:transposase-like protein
MEIRPVKYRNNIVEPDHRFIKKVIQPGLGFQSIQTAAKTISGIEAMHILWKGQILKLCTHKCGRFKDSPGSHRLSQRKQ